MATVVAGMCVAQQLWMGTDRMFNQQLGESVIWEVAQGNNNGVECQEGRLSACCQSAGASLAQLQRLPTFAGSGEVPILNLASWEILQGEWTEPLKLELVKKI